MEGRKEERTEKKTKRQEEKEEKGQKDTTKSFGIPGSIDMIKDAKASKNAQQDTPKQDD